MCPKSCRYAVSNWQHVADADEGGRCNLILSAKCAGGTIWDYMANDFLLILALISRHVTP